jgi:hypothetical protein
VANKFSGKTKAGSESAQHDENQTEQASGGSDATENPAPAEGEVKTTKSIVPAKYAGKYKDPANDDALRTFIKEQTYENGKVNLDKFYELCLANGVPAEQVTKYKTQTDAKVGGASGRAVMTLRNLMSTVARKGEGMKGLDGKTYDVKIAKAALTGAAADAAAKTEDKAA